MTIIEGLGSGVCKSLADSGWPNGVPSPSRAQILESRTDRVGRYRSQLGCGGSVSGRCGGEQLEGASKAPIAADRRREVLCAGVVDAGRVPTDAGCTLIEVRTARGRLTLSGLLNFVRRTPAWSCMGLSWT